MALGTAALGLIGSGIGAVAQSSSAKSAAKSQEAAANRQIDLQERIYGETTARFDPFLQTGTRAQNALAYELGLGERPMIGGTPLAVTEVTSGGLPQGVPAGAAWFEGGPGDPGGFYSEGQRYSGQATPRVTQYRAGDQTFDDRAQADAFARANMTGGTEYQGFQKTPGYDFQLSQGMDSLQSTAAARGGLMSGATLQAAQGFGQGLANQEYGNYLSRLGSMASGGQAAAGAQANAGANYGAQAGNALAGIGNAQAAGAIGSGNAIAGGINNAMGWLGYMGAQQPQQAGNQAGMFSTPWAAKGFWG